MFMTLLLVAGVAASIWLRWRHQHRGMLKAADQFPGPRAMPVLGNAMQFICSPEEMIVVLKKMIAEYGEIVKFWLGPDLNVIVSSPDELKILLTNSKLSFKGPVYKFMSDVLGGGILSGSGPAWRRHRKIANPNYGKRAIEFYSQIFNEEVDLLIEEFKRIPPNKQFDMYENIVRTTSYSVCRTLMGLTKKQTLNLPYLQEIIDKTPFIYDIVFSRMTKWYLQIDPVFWISDNYKVLKDFSHKISEFAKDILKHRTEYLKSLGEDFKIEHMDMKEDATLSVIDRFLLSEELEQEELVKETFTIFTSSQEASAKIASFLLLMMAYHPEFQEKLYNEVRGVMGDADRDVTDDDLKQMPYLEMAFKEVLRLFPIGAILQRTVTEDIAIRSGYLPAGCSLVIPIYHLQRDPRFWENPDAFDPERFNPENVERRHPSAYIPFSLGPMDCLGRYFGTKLVKTICTRVIREFELTSLDSYKDLRVIISISVVSVDGYHVMMKRRTNTNNDQAI